MVFSFVSYLKIKNEISMMETTKDQLEMGKCIYVIGEAGAGKSTFIANNYMSDDFFRIEFPRAFLDELKSTGEVEMELLLETYNQLVGDLLDAFFDNKTLVVEFCAGTENDEEYRKLIERSSSAGIHTSLVMLTCDDDKREERLLGAVDESSYVSSLLLQPHVLEIYEGVVESIEMSKNMGLVS